MESIYLNYKDIQFLLNCNSYQAKEIIYSHLEWHDKKDISSPNYVKAKHFVDASVFNVVKPSFCNSIHNKPFIQLLISEIRSKGISCSLKHEVLEDVKNIIRGGLFGRYNTLKRILTKDQVFELEESLKRRRELYLASANKIPKNLEKYVKLNNQQQNTLT